MYATDCNDWFFSRDLGITHVVRCNLLWARAKEAGSTLHTAVWSYDEVFCSVTKDLVIKP